ncbi:hypothetical protein QR680_011929 [Steinernema hermaphroditum]|uniref:Uncharacterized protein n=1 Tax=Steinernema hermaphroditum TaxID=289476 RepID=A0AA39I082_9BILA|nr:hypothetical protein QR680_011929 [Steinernema hermaphroditum]
MKRNEEVLDTIRENHWKRFLKPIFARNRPQNQILTQSSNNELHSYSTTFDYGTLPNTNHSNISKKTASKRTVSQTEKHLKRLWNADTNDLLLRFEDEQKLKVAEFLDDCVERGVLHRCYARMLLRSIRKLKEEESAEGLKPSKKKTSVFPVKKIPMKVSQKNNYVCVKAPFKKASSSTAFVKTPPKQMTLSDDEL